MSRNSLLASGVVVGIVVGIAQSASMAQRGSAADAVVKAVSAHWEAINAGDSAAIERHHTADFTMFMPEFGTLVTVSSPEVQSFIAKTKPNWKPRDIKVQMVGSAAVATFFLDGSATFEDGRVDSRTRRVTEVWVNQNGSWREAHHHDSVHSPLK